jgi:hypothetical protein
LFERIEQWIAGQTDLGEKRRTTVDGLRHGGHGPVEVSRTDGRDRHGVPQ